MTTQNQKSKLQRFKQGVMDMSELQKLQVTYWGNLGTVIGLSLALISMIVMMFYFWSWQVFFFSFVTLFAILIQWVSFITVRKQYNNMIQLNDKNSEIFERVKNEMQNRYRTGTEPKQASVSVGQKE